jgi:predicted Zn-dependent protease with MMP-like domain
MAHDKQWVVDLLRRLGLTQAADEAEQTLPDQVSTEELMALGDKYGISRDELESRMGGSP